MNSLTRNLKRLLSQPDFVVAFLLLGVSAVSLNFVTNFMKLHFRKQAVPLRVQLDAPDGIPANVGSWVLVTKDPPLDPDVEHVLGTHEYINRVYVDSRAVDASRLASMKDMSGNERAVALSELEVSHPEAIIHLGITYYTGLVDTVAHIPDRCYIADGFDVTSYDTRTDQVLGKYPDGTDRVASFRYLNFDDQSGRGRISRNVAYLFNVNGRYESDPLGVRRSLANLFERYGYYAKVELMTVSPAPSELDAAAAQAVRSRSLDAMEDFLSSLLPEVERCLPDWKKLHAAGAHG